MAAAAAAAIHLQPFGERGGFVHRGLPLDHRDIIALAFLTFGPPLTFPTVATVRVRVVLPAKFHATAGRMGIKIIIIVIIITAAVCILSPLDDRHTIWLAFQLWDRVILLGTGKRSGQGGGG